MSKHQLLSNVVTNNNKSVSKKNLSNDINNNGDDNGYVINDKNYSTLLIRNALGGSNKNQLTALMSIPPHYSRRFYDDTTVKL